MISWGATQGTTRPVALPNILFLVSEAEPASRKLKELLIESLQTANYQTARTCSSKNYKWLFQDAVVMPWLWVAG